MYFYSTSPTVSECTFSGNSAGTHGGGVYIGTASPSIVDCTFSGNSTGTGNGGAIYSYSSSASAEVTISDCAFSGNYAGGNGGAIQSHYLTSPTITNCTISGNAAGNHGNGISNSSSASPTITNTILWDDEAIYNAASTCAPEVAYSIVKDGCASYDYTACGGGNLSSDPEFVSSTDLRLQATSPAIDVGDNAAVPSGVTTDLDGNPRIVCGDLSGGAGVDGGAVDCVVDKGAYEYQP